MSRCVRRELMLALCLLAFGFVPSAADAQVAPSALTCQVLQQNVQLSWANAEPYDFIEVRRNGVLVQTLPGSTTAYLDPGVPASFHFYTVHGVIGVTVGAGATCAVQVIPPPLEPPLEPPPSLKTQLPPMPAGLFNYIKDVDAAVRLGKAFFWDMQTGSDGVTACATCHYHAGADNRARNVIAPGPDGVFDVGGPNYRVQVADFPFHKLSDPQDANSFLLSDNDDRVGSQGVHAADFVDVAPGFEEDVTTSVPDATFNIGGLNMRQTTGRNAPTVINAIYNIENFWDGRASFWFNGRNPFGQRDTNASVLQVQLDGTVAPTGVLLDRASLASQAVGPPNSSMEMAAHGRDFQKLGKKLLSLQPLQFQEVHPSDSVLGALVDVDGLGLNASYVTMIQDAFQNEWWQSDRIFDATLTEIGQGTPLNTNEYSLMEANFSFFWGLAIMMYESTLVSDDSPFDQYQDGDDTALTAEELQGLDVFTRTNCLLCHTTPVFTSAVSTKLTVVLEPEANALEGILERMPMKDALLAVYDGGFYNIGVRPTAEDIGRGGLDPFGNPLSFAGMVQQFGPESLPFPDGTIILNPPPQPFEEIAMAGAMKTPTLRNTELTGPYFHNGSYATLDQVIDFYARGGDFATLNQDTLAPEILPMPFLLNDPAKEDALVAFLGALTDERVRQEMAPFDHPQLFIAEGAVGDTATVQPAFVGAPFAADRFKEIPAVGAGGRPADGLTPLLEFLQPQAVSALACADAGGLGISLSWQNFDVYPLVRIERDGQLVAVLPGATQSFTDANFIPGSWDYDVFAVDGTQIGLHTVCTVEIAPDAPSAVTATQLATGVAVNWTNTYAYDEIEVRRDGVTLTNLVAGSTVFIDGGAVPGAHQYEVIGSVEGVPSAPTPVTLTVLPAQILALTCSTGAGTTDLSWTNGSVYDSIEILRDGAPLASLLGTATSHQDLAPLSGVSEYTVIGRTNATDSLAATCLVSFGPAPITGMTCSENAGSGQIAWINGDTYTAIEVQRDGVSIATLPGSATSATDPDLGLAGPGIHEYTLLPSTDGISTLSTACSVTIVPAAVTGATCNAIATGNLISWTNGTGYDAIEVRRDGVAIATLAGNANFHLDENLLPGSFTYEVVALADAVPSIATGCSVSRNPVPVAGLTCLDIPAGVALAWTNQGTYDEVRVLRNGALLATVGGTETSFLDASPPTGIVTYSVRSAGAGLVAPSAPSCSVSVAPTAVTALTCSPANACGDTVIVTWNNPELYDSIELQVDGVATATLPGISEQTTVNFAVSGAHTVAIVPIKQALPGASTECTTIVLDDVALAPIGLTTVTDPQTCTVDASWSAQGIYTSIELRVDGVTVETLPGSATSATVVIGASGTHLLEVIASTECGTALGAISETVVCDSAFRRGDSNADGQNDISDAIFTLRSVFALGPAPTCADAADANDDGVLDISDAIAGLQTVFGQAGDLALPYLACGDDPSADSLGCAVFSSCP